jgi:GNAT superfamily N-acetyltransferase
MIDNVKDDSLDRNRVISAAFRSQLNRSYMTLEQFIDGTANWYAEPVMIEGELAGAVLMNGPEIHACILPDYFGKWLTRALLRRTLAKVLRENGKAITSTTQGNANGSEFVRRLGFSHSFTSDGVMHFELKRMKNGY